MSDAGATGLTEVRPLTADDLEFASALHADALPDGFFVALGPNFLERYYGAFVGSPYGVALLATHGRERRGVLVGTIDDAGHYRWVFRNHGGRLASAALRGLVRDPRLALRFARTRARRYARGAVRLGRRNARHGESAPVVPTSGALTHVAVVAESRDNGVGSKLVDAYVSAAFARGARRLRVATRAESGTADFYRRLGWCPSGSVRNLDGVAFDVLTLER